MTSIVRHFSQDHVTSYDSARATPAAYRDAELDGFSVIHFTAHATANVESPLDSAVVLCGPRHRLQAVRARRGRQSR